MVYIHTQRPKIKKYMNETEWMPNTLQEAEEQVISSSSAQTLRPQEKQTNEESFVKGKEPEKGITGKRSREEKSPGTDISIKYFRLKYKKKAKKQHMEIDKGSPPQTAIKIIDILDSSLAGGKSFPSTPTSERQQTLQVYSSKKVTKEKE